MMNHNRRQFLHHSVGLASAWAGVSVFAPNNARAMESDHTSTIPLGLVALSQDFSLANIFIGRHGFVFSAIHAPEAGSLDGFDGARLLPDAHAVIHDPRVSAIVVAGGSPDDRTHIAGIAARSGKHVYIEAPVAERTLPRSGVVIHAHLTCRSRSGLRQAVDALWSGKYGWVEKAHVVSHQSLGATFHALDLARWGLALWEEPSTVETQDRHQILKWSQNTMIVDEAIGNSEPIEGLHEGVVFHGSKGKVVCTLRDSAIGYTADGNISAVFKGSGDPVAAFARAIRSESKLACASWNEAVQTSALLALARRSSSRFA